MKKTLLATAIAVSALASVNAQADIAVTSMTFGATTYAAGGSLNDDGSGNAFSIDPFYGQPWTASQETLFMDSTGSWAGTSLAGAYDYDATIAAMTVDQVAVGMFFNWNNNNEIAVLEVFDCTTGPDICQGVGIPMANGPFTGQIATFAGTGTATVVPVPAAVWLMGSGLLGLVGVARRRKHA